MEYIYFGGPAFDSIPDLLIPDYTKHAASAGDLNGDGIDDFMTSYDMESSSFSYVNIYYGGQYIDSIADLVINVAEMPEYLLNFGMDVAGLGDVNGDSINDFAISAVDNNSRGVVYIFSGNKSGTDVEEVKGNPLPASILLQQNYPNPFNSSTQIRFSLPRLSSIKLTVVDLLGRKVQTLSEGEYKAGTYTATWSGEKVSSGVYFCVLEADGVKLTQKMVLLK